MCLFTFVQSISKTPTTKRENHFPVFTGVYLCPDRLGHTFSEIFGTIKIIRKGLLLELEWKYCFGFFFNLWDKRTLPQWTAITPF